MQCLRTNYSMLGSKLELNCSSGGHQSRTTNPLVPLLCAFPSSTTAQALEIDQQADFVDPPDRARIDPGTEGRGPSGHGNETIKNGQVSTLHPGTSGGERNCECFGLLGSHHFSLSLSKNAPNDPQCSERPFLRCVQKSSNWTSRASTGWIPTTINVVCLTQQP